MYIWRNFNPVEKLFIYKYLTNFSKHIRHWWKMKLLNNIFNIIKNENIGTYHIHIFFFINKFSNSSKQKCWQKERTNIKPWSYQVCIYAFCIVVCACVCDAFSVYHSYFVPAWGKFVVSLKICRKTYKGIRFRFKWFSSFTLQLEIQIFSQNALLQTFFFLFTATSNFLFNILGSNEKREKFVVIILFIYSWNSI